MQKWEYLQLYLRSSQRTVFLIDNTGRTWVCPWGTELNLEPDIARDYLNLKKPPYYLHFPLPPQVLDELGSEGWMVTSDRLISPLEDNLIFRRPKE